MATYNVHAVVVVLTRNFTDCIYMNEIWIFCRKIGGANMNAGNSIFNSMSLTASRNVTGSKNTLPGSKGTAGSKGRRMSNAELNEVHIDIKWIYL